MLSRQARAARRQEPSRLCRDSENELPALGNTWYCAECGVEVEPFELGTSGLGMTCSDCASEAREGVLTSLVRTVFEPFYTCLLVVLGGAFTLCVELVGLVLRS